MDLAALRRLGVRPSQLSRTISEIFAEMIFMFGDVHCDPHAANLLIRKKVCVCVMCTRCKANPNTPF